MTTTIEAMRQALTRETKRVRVTTKPQGDLVISPKPQVATDLRALLRTSCAQADQYATAQQAWQSIMAQRGLPTLLARSLGISVQALSQWDVVPLDRVVEVEHAIGILRENLRPDFHLPRSRNG
jgi:hypothetical protein